MSLKKVREVLRVIKQIGGASNVRDPEPLNKSQEKFQKIEEDGTSKVRLPDNVPIPGSSPNSFNSSKRVSESLGNFGSFSDDDRESDVIERKPRASVFVGNLSSFCHKDDIDYLLSFVNKFSSDLNSDLIKHIEKELERIEKLLKRCFAVEAKMLENHKTSAQTLKQIFEAVKAGASGGSGIYYGGDQDSDGVTTTEALRKYMPEEIGFETDLTTRAVEEAKRPYKPVINRINECQYTGMSLIKRYYLLNDLKAALEDKEQFETAKESLEYVKNNLKVFKNVKSD